MAESNNVIKRRRGGSRLQARSTVFRVETHDSDVSQQLDYFDEFEGVHSLQSIIISPPYSPKGLFSLIEKSNTLKPCIEAYVTNTVEVGWELEPLYEGMSVNAGEKMEAESFLENANSEESLCAVMRKVIWDRECVGYGFLEVVRDALGRLSLLRHAPSLITRLCHKHPVAQLVRYDISRGRRVSTVQEYRKFRRYIQLVGGQEVYFKEYGDPRQMDRVTGSFEGESGYDPSRPATEIYHFKLPSAEPYGVPRWVMQTPSVVGGRKAEEVNMNYFDDNTVPPMMLTVSGGRLTQHSFRELNNMLRASKVGKDRQNKIMLIEAVSDGDSLDKNGSPVQLKVEKLTDARQSDGLFADYDRANQAKIRQSWRIPAILLGQVEGSNYSNVQLAVAVADSQVFAPARWVIDEMLNKGIFNARTGLGLRTCKVVSRTPAISSPDTMIKALTALNVMGGVTPRSAISTANTVLPIELPEYPSRGSDNWEPWMDMPLPLVKTTNSHEEQASKTQRIKDLEDGGDIGAKRPENGAETEEADE